MIRVYGIRQCDSCRRTLKWLEANELAFEFTDLRESPVGPEQIDRWLQRLGPERLVNRRSITWRRLDGDQRSRTMGTEGASLLAEHPTLIKRPVVEQGDALTVGFQPDAWGAT